MRGWHCPELVRQQGLTYIEVALLPLMGFYYDRLYEDVTVLSLLLIFGLGHSRRLRPSSLRNYCTTLTG